MGWKGDSNHRKVGYGLIGNLGNALQGKFVWGYIIPFQAWIRGRILLVNTKLFTYDAPTWWYGFSECKKTWSWVLCTWFLFCAQKKGKSKECKGFYFWRTIWDLLVFLENFLTMSTKNINYFLNQKPNFMFPDILKNNIHWIFKIVITTWIKKFKNFITNLHTRGWNYEWYVHKLISLKLTFILF